MISNILNGLLSCSLITSKKWDTSSVIWSSKRRFPKPKPLSADKENVICSFHSLPLAANIPVKKEYHSFYENSNRVRIYMYLFILLVDISYDDACTLL